MRISCEWAQIAAVSGNRLYLDYVSGQGAARSLMTYPPQDYHAALDARRAHSYPRREVADRLQVYNARLGARGRALENIDALRHDETWCVIAGQQVGFLGGPVYTAYKIVHTIRLAEQLSQRLGARVTPLFWLASEDHDLGEINHIHYIQPDGEVGRIGFSWEGEGRPIADLPAHGDVYRAYEGYFDALGGGSDDLRRCLAPRSGEGYCDWHGRLWAELFSARGLVLVEPSLLRPMAGDMFARLLTEQGEIHQRLNAVAARLRQLGYAVALAPESYGQLFTFNDGGRRMRVEQPWRHIASAQAHPERYSTDAALRPLVADALLPVLASVLGPGEIAYQAMLRPLYELFGVPQPVLVPRQSYTIFSTEQVERLRRYRLAPEQLLGYDLDLEQAAQALISDDELSRYEAARRGLEAALAPLRPHLREVDPSLDRNWEQTLANALRGLEKLQERGLKAQMGKEGLSKGELRALVNLALPRGRPQERVLPLPHFLHRFGRSFLERLYEAAPLDALAHHILVWEQEHA